MMSALGITIVLHPSFEDGSVGKKWYVVCFDRRGHWKSGSIYDTEQEAKSRRAWLFRHHRKLAKKRGS